MSMFSGIIVIVPHTDKRAVIENHMIHWTYHLEASCWKLEGGDVLLQSTFDLIIDTASTIKPDSYNSDMGSSK